MSKELTVRRISFTTIFLGLALGGCVPPPYPPAYRTPIYGQPNAGPDGFTYSEGYPVEVIDGYQAEFLYAPELGGWGYYDGGRRWHGAPSGMRDRLERSHPNGRGLPPHGGFHGEGGRPGPSYRDGPGRPGSGFFGNGQGHQPNRDQQPNRLNPGQNPGPGRPEPGGPQSHGNQPRQGGQPQGEQRHPPNGNCQPGQPRC